MQCIKDATHCFLRNTIHGRDLLLTLCCCHLFDLAMVKERFDESVGSLEETFSSDHSTLDVITDDLIMTNLRFKIGGHRWGGYVLRWAFRHFPIDKPAEMNKEIRINGIA